MKEEEFIWSNFQNTYCYVKKDKYRRVTGIKKLLFYIVAQSCLTLLQPHGLQTARLFCPWDTPGKNTGAACHFLLQGDLSDPGIEPTSPLLHWQEDSLPLSHQGSLVLKKRRNKIHVCIYLLKPKETRKAELDTNDTG